MFYALMLFPNSLQNLGAKSSVFFHWGKYSTTSRNGLANDHVLKKNLLSSIKRPLKSISRSWLVLRRLAFQFNTARRIPEFIKSLTSRYQNSHRQLSCHPHVHEIASSDNSKPSRLYLYAEKVKKTFGDMLDAIEGKQKWEDISGLS